MYILLIILLSVLPVSAFGATTYLTGDAESGSVMPPWQDDSAGVSNTTEQAHNGSRSYKFDLYPSVNTTGSKVADFTQSAHASDAGGAYFSAWFYIAAGYELDGKWRNNFEFKINNFDNTCGGFVGPKMGLGFNNYEVVAGTNVRQLYLGVLDSEGTFTLNPGAIGTGGKVRQTNPVPVPVQQWFHIEVYYKAATTNGRIIVWQDGQLIFDLSGPNFDTLRRRCTGGFTTNTYLYWLIGSYADSTVTSRQLVYADDARVTDYRVSAGISTKPPAPTGLRIVSSTP